MTDNKDVETPPTTSAGSPTDAPRSSQTDDVANTNALHKGESRDAYRRALREGVERAKEDGRQMNASKHLYKNREKEEEMSKVEIPTIVTTGGNDNTAAIIAAMAANGNNNNDFGGMGSLGMVAMLGLLGNGGFGGRNENHGGEGCVTPSNLSAALAGVMDSQASSIILQGISDVKAAVPLAEGQVQLALAGGVGEIRSHIGAVENALVAGQATINKAVSDAVASSLASQNNINTNLLTSAAGIKEAVTTFGVANLNATKDAAFANQQAINASTKDILAAINDQNITTLQRQLGVAESALLEERGHGRFRDAEINITNTNTAVAQQLQTQNQQQQQLQTIAQLTACVQNLANDIQVVRQSQSNINFGTQAGVGQTSNATNNTVGQ